ncbi:MAG: aminoacyl-tRNA hydrolase, partial [Clostridiales Family XIII bacterium]|nr:aminoacyl-tRNA hydrolase [Clostridiales Family XIII bacterium]
MYVVIGLGNPGKKYENTKHNIGFIAVDRLAGRNGIRIGKLRHKALTGEGLIGNQKVMLAKPQTYMNLSGESVVALVRYFDVAPEKLIVIYDDVDIPMGSIRIRKSGSAGTHNGMRSILLCLREEGFPRIRIGVGAERGDMPLADYVLTGFGKDEAKTMEDAVDRAVFAAEC